MFAGLRHFFKLTSTTTVILVAVCTIGFNVLTFAFAPLANMMLAAVQWLGVQPTLAAASELANIQKGKKAAVSLSEKLGHELDSERKRVAQLELDIKAGGERIKEVQRKLDLEKKNAAKLADELSLSKSKLKSKSFELDQSRRRAEDLTSIIDDLRKTPRLPTSTVEQIDSLTKRIVQRSGVNAARNLASMPLESVPVVGALTIVSVTALEVYDACQTSAEMEDLRRLANLPDVDTSVIRSACAKMPTIGGLDGLTLAECREHERNVLVELGTEAAMLIKDKCDCLELPDGCPGEEMGTMRVLPPKPELP